MRDVYNCNELPAMEDRAAIDALVAEYQITDVIDMTNRFCTHKTAAQQSDDEEGQPSEKLVLPKEVRVFRPKFSTPLDLRQIRKGH
mmetsp:Transcript_22089/g.27165  ORF Transcript_22089/g.27165 Transcript_22089/m.27165 type:complete len:86 (-) Transcript_22089:692-949(-)